MLSLSGATLPEALQRKLDVSAYGGPVRAISSYRRPNDPKKIMVDVERAPEANGTVTREGNSVVFTFQVGAVPTTVSGVASDGGVARKSHTVAREASLDTPRACRRSRRRSRRTRPPTSTSRPRSRIKLDAFLLPTNGVAAQQRLQPSPERAGSTSI